MKRKAWLGALVVVALVAATGVAWAVLSSYGPVRVISADTFDSSGDLISGWYWLRDASNTDTATWTFTDVPTTTAGAKNSKVYVRFDPLVTNKASGGPGYSTTVRISYKDRSGKTVKHSLALKNTHPELKDARDSAGWGYQAAGYFSIPVTKIPKSGQLAITMKRLSGKGYHVAANEGACTIEFLSR